MKNSNNSKPPSINYEELAKKIIEEHNRVRLEPSSYIPKLEESLNYFRGDILYKPGENPLKTSEGKAAFEEAIEFLKRQKPINKLTHDSRLTSACSDLISDIGPKGITSHESTDGKNASDRIEQYCEWENSCCENLDFGTNIAEDIIINFIVDDGIPKRLQRKNLFNPELNFIGVACGEHKEYEIATVVNYVGVIRDLGEINSNSKNFIQEYLKREEERKMNPNKPKNPFQLQDPDAPDDTLSIKIVKTTKIVKGKPKKITRKIYSLEDGTQHIVEIEDS